MSELALAAFAAAHDMHAVARETRSSRFARFAETFDEEIFVAGLHAAGLRWVAASDPTFPPRLKAIHDPPPGLFLRGHGASELLAQPSVAIVGARSCSDYGAHVGRALARELGAAGALVISGMARGVDGWAHRGALEAGGSTVAVLGCGIDRDYPRAHSALAREISERGLLVAEYPPGVAPAPWRFPARNRIVAGLTLATVVVEARERSGALITADLALEEGRDVLVVPGEITSALSRGSNALLRLGAQPVLDVGDVLDVLGIERDEQPPAGAVGAAAAQCLAAIDGGAMTADEIVHASGLAAPAVAAALIELELAGVISCASGVYRR